MSKEQTTEDRFLFTPENLLENLHKLGPWSAYGLASVALQHYFPHEYDEDGSCEVAREAELIQQLGCTNWDEAIVKYHKEVGYVAPNGFDPDFVNQY